MGNELDFTGKTVLVVGGSSGIGNGMAQAFLKRGARVHVWGTRASAVDYAGAIVAAPHVNRATIIERHEGVVIHMLPAAVPGPSSRRRQEPCEQSAAERASFGGPGRSHRATVRRAVPRRVSRRVFTLAATAAQARRTCESARVTC